MQPPPGDPGRPRGGAPLALDRAAAGGGPLPAATRTGARLRGRCLRALPRGEAHGRAPPSSGGKAVGIPDWQGWLPGGWGNEWRASHPLRQDKAPAQTQDELQLRSGHRVTNTHYVQYTVSYSPAGSVS